MKLTKEQKNQIYNKNMTVDDWEWVPCINHVLRILNYDDNLIHDENYETVKWSGTEPLIKDEKIRKAVRAWAEANGVFEVMVAHPSFNTTTIASISDPYKQISFSNERAFLPKDKVYTIAELCGEEE